MTPSEEVAEDWFYYDTDIVYRTKVRRLAHDLHAKQCLCGRGLTADDAWIEQVMQDLRRIYE